jgi:hypothetical protein
MEFGINFDGKNNLNKTKSLTICKNVDRFQVSHNFMSINSFVDGKSASHNVEIKTKYLRGLKFQFLLLLCVIVTSQVEKRFAGRCQFHQHFTRGFFVRKFRAKLFFVLRFRVCTFLAQKYRRKS